MNAPAVLPLPARPIHTDESGVGGLLRRLPLGSLQHPFLWLTLLAIGVVALLPIVLGSAPLREEIFLMLMLAVLASSINIIMGYTGYVSFGHVVFFGLGGYFSFFLMMRLGLHFLAAAPAAALGATLCAALLGSAVLRLRGAYFALATIGVNEATRSLVTNLPLFGGATGMFFNFSIYKTYGGPGQALWLAYYAMVVVALATVLTSFLIKQSKLGLGLMAIREDQDAAEVLGINPARYKVAAYSASAFFPALAGATFFFKNGVIEPGSAFHLLTSIEALVMVMLGGVGTVGGPIVGAVLYERLRAFLLTSKLFSSLHVAIAGMLLLLIVLFVTRGVVGELRHRLPKLRAYFE